ncbi:hypothetical protein TeGR_g6804 [Tetraparma gracilis]|uniref:Flavin-containing monooxygenase n=1 Tax=Tetraparma gracilis TaxID=2962635 RepID=A0ABQ6N2N8_9STRA|nr:hypothetical protein TeGR_g6804 [Tetraparma gracilis]
MIESLQPIAGQLLLFQRSPKWVLPKPFLRFPPLLLYPLQKLLPFNLGNRILRGACFLAIEFLHCIVRRPSFVQRLFTGHLKSRILSSNPDAQAMNCMPEYRPGCSRIIVHAGFPHTLTKSNVTVVNDSVTGLTPSGEVATKTSSGEVVTYAPDVIIYATGFSVTDCGPQFEVTNGAGEALKSTWKSALDRWGGATLFGITTPLFPNFFVMYGPHTNTILGSITFFSECAASYVSQCVSHVLKAGKKSVTVKESSVTSYGKYVTKSFQGRPELDSCSAWYKGSGGGLPVTNFPGGMLEFWWLVRRFQVSDYTVE